MEKEKVVVPEIGMGATYGYGSDCYPGTVIWVSSSGKKIKVQGDNYKRTDKAGPFTESQEYEYSEDKGGPIYEFSLRKDGIWKEVGSNSHTVGLGFRRAYQDPHF
ncbi:hypothetical protein D3C87_75650 [compost metagenome]